MKVFGLQFDKQNILNSNEIQRRVAKLMTLATNKLVKLAESEGITIEEDYPLNLDNYPKYKKMVDKEMVNLVSKISQELSDGAKTQWDLANAKNDSLVKQFVGRVSVPEDILKSWMNPNLKALEVFQNRKYNGRNLSDRVWETANALKGNLGMALDVALGEGKSANELSRDIRKYLIEPEKLFRRVRDKHGGLHLSKEAKKYSPGAGVYRSSYKNAMRLARTEINSAYRTADNLRIQKLDFVVGIEIRRSNRVFECDVCSSLVGKYPKEFNFTGWHPQCRCFALTILSTKDEFVDEMKALLNGEQTNAESENTIKEMPPNFNKWLEDNKESIERSIEKGTEPYWVKDNREFVMPSLPPEEVKFRRMDTLEEAQQWALDNIKGINTADYSGISIADANKVNRVLIDLQNQNIIRGDETYNFIPFKDGRENAVGGSYQMMKHSHGGTANLKIDVKFETATNRTIRKAEKYREKIFNQQLRDSQKILESAKQEIFTNDNSPSGWKYAQEGRRGVLEKIIAFHEERLKNFKGVFEKEEGDRYKPRFSTRARTMKDALVHEYGHILNADLQTNRDKYPRAVANLLDKIKDQTKYKESSKNVLYSPYDNLFDKNAEKYGRQISSYASTCGTEYFAESFLMFMQGDELPDKDLEKLFKLLIK